MGHRHMLGSSHMFDSGHDQNWNHMQTEQPYALGIVPSNFFGWTLIY